MSSPETKVCEAKPNSLESKEILGSWATPPYVLGFRG